MKTRQQIRIVILDLDETAYCSVSERSDKLSQPIIDRVMQGNYNALYGCTHRSYSTLHECRGIALKIASTRPGFSYDDVINNFCTHKIMSRMADVTKLPLLAVSMADDLLYERAGAAFETLIKPYEKTHDPARNSNPEDEEHIVSDTDKPHLTIRQTYDAWKTKNPQLTQIARHAREQYPDADIVLDFFDDRKHLCEKAIHAHQEQNWPEGVTLNAFHYEFKKELVTPVTLEPVSGLRISSVFTDKREVAQSAADEAEPSLGYKS